MPKRVIKTKVKRCTRCMLPETYPGISFDKQGVCNLCIEWKKRPRIDYPKREGDLKKIIEEHRNENKDCKYDCVLGVSGGKDSTYALYYLVKKLGLRVLAVNFNVGFNPLTAHMNIIKAINRLGVDMFALRIEWGKLKRIYSIFLRRTGSLCIPCNSQKIHAIKTAAMAFNTKIIFTGVSQYDEGSMKPGMFGNDALKKVLLKEMSMEEVEEFLIPSWKDYKAYFLDAFVKWDSNKILSIIKKELGWENPSVQSSQKGYHREHHTDCDWFPMDCYFRWKSGGFDRLTMADSIAIRKGEKKRAGELKRERKAEKQNKKLPSIARKLLKKLDLSIEDIKLERKR